MFGKDAESKTDEANTVTKSFGISDDTLAEVEDFKAQLTKHNAWDLPFMGYVNEDGYGYAYVPDAAVAYDPYWDSHKAFLELPEDVQAAFAIRLLFATVRSTVTVPACSCTISVGSTSSLKASARITTDRILIR